MAITTRGLKQTAIILPLCTPLGHAHVQGTCLVQVVECRGLQQTGAQP